ncbi:MAG: SphA family protein [Kiritimatiellia bacterium]
MQGYKLGLGLVVCGLLISVVSSSLAEPANHYPLGLEGIKAGTVPPPGVYLRVYNYGYVTDTLKDSDGNKVPVDLDVKVYALAPRLIWVTEQEVLGGNLGADVLLPLVWTSVKIGAMGIDDNDWNLGDLYFEPLLLAWHGERYDLGAGVAFFAPTADADKKTSAGKEYWTTMLTLGGTYYADAEKTLSFSVLGRYEIHGEKSGSDLTRGNDFHVEWGVAKTVNQTWDFGVAGYCQWQMTKDKGSDSTDVKDQVYAVGPEVSCAMPKIGLLGSLRLLWEFDARDRTEGSTGVLTVTKIF